MKARRLLATSMLAALPLLVGALQTGSRVSEADADGATYAAERPSGPRALWWAGIDGKAAILASLGFVWSPGLALGSAL